jgi:hypothetical protein
MPTKLVLSKEQKINARGDYIPAGTVVAEITFNENIPGNFQQVHYIGSAINTGMLIDEAAMPKPEQEPELPAAVRRIHTEDPDHG